MSFEHLLTTDEYALSAQEKNTSLVKGLIELTNYHKKHCPKYANILKAIGYQGQNCIALEDIPFIPVNLFKNLKLHSIPNNNDVVTVLNSSSTTGQNPSKIFIDKETSRRQSLALTKSIKSIVGDKRLPMLIIDAPSTIKQKPLTARGAGILGLMRFGHSHCFALDERLNLDVSLVEQFLRQHSTGPFIIFGFTFIAWHHFLKECPAKTDLSNGILIHSGGWKKMQNQSVSPADFKTGFQEKTNLCNCVNFYGLVEQIGSIYLEGCKGLLYPPAFSDVIIRDPFTLEPVPHGEEGLIQLLSLLPLSYPGHSILTSDMGILHKSPESTTPGLEITRRVPRAETRGCSDTFEIDLT